MNAPRVIDAVGVIVPAHDEAATIATTIASVQESLRRVDVDEACIVVVADACTDRTVAIARSLLEHPHVVVEVGHRCVGGARAEGSVVALERLATPPERCWLLGIDGDSVARPDWVAQHLAHAARGVECVTGIVELELTASAELRRAFAATYLAAVDGRSHTHVHGTNFGIRGDTLLAAGNWAALRTGEDHALWQAVAALGRRAEQDPSIVVTTSSRTEGRAPAGFAADLAAIVPDAPAC